MYQMKTAKTRRTTQCQVSNNCRARIETLINSLIFTNKLKEASYQ